MTRLNQGNHRPPSVSTLFTPPRLASTLFQYVSKQFPLPKNNSRLIASSHISIEISTKKSTANF